MRWTFIVTSVAMLALAACQSTGGGSGERLLVPADAAPGTYWQGERSQSTERAFTVARTDREWAELWARAGREPPSSLPSGQMAVGVFLGYRETAGYDVVIERVGREDGELVVAYRERVPGPTQAVALVMTSPYAIRLVPAADGMPKFRRVK